MRSTKTPANLNGSARPDGNPKPTIQDQSPERGCGSYSRCVALSGVVLFSPSGFPFPTNAPHRATWGLLFWLVSCTIFCFHLCAEYARNFVDFSFGLWPANKSQEIKWKFHKIFTKENIDITIRPPKRSEKWNAVISDRQPWQNIIKMLWVSCRRWGTHE